MLLYVGQVCLPPKGFGATEAASVCKVLGFATNALNHDACFSLDMLGGLKMSRPSFAMFASRFRAGCKTVSDCDSLLAKLRTLKEDNLPAWSAFGNNFTPGWDPLLFVPIFARRKRVEGCP